MSFPAKLIRFLFTLLVIFVPLIFLPNTSELFEFNKMVLVYIFTTLIVMAWITRMIFEKKLIFEHSILDIPLSIFLLTQLASLMFSIDPRVSLMGYYSRFNGGLLSLLCYSLLYWSAVSNIDRKSTLSIIKWSLISATLVTIWGFLEHFGIDANWWVQDVQIRVFSTLGQPNWLAAYLIALIFIPISSLLKKFSWWHTTVAILLFVVLLYTKSRSGLMAFGISSVIFWGIIFLKNRSVLKSLLIFTIITLTLTLTISNPIRDLALSKVNLIKPQTQNTPVPAGTSLETGGTESGTIRKIVWTGAIRIWQASSKNFWLGSGPETFAMAYYQHRPFEHNATSEWELLYNKAHNEFLNYLATTGLLGLLSYLALLTFMLITFIKYQKTNPNWNLIIALTAGWLTIPITNFWGFSVVMIQVLMFLLPAFAITLQKETPIMKLGKLNTWQTFGLILTSSSAIFLLYSISIYWLADVYYASGQKDFRAFNATQEPQYVLSSYQNLTMAYELNPTDPSISSELSVTAAFLSLLVSQNDATASAQLANIANMASLRAIEKSPYHPNYYKSRSRAMVVLGTLDPKYFADSDEALMKAQSISPTDPRIPYIRGINAKYDNHPDLAVKYFEEALTLKPDFADAINQLKNLANPSSKSPLTQ